MARTQYHVNVYHVLGEVWDGDVPLDPACTWICCNIVIIKQCGCCGLRNEDDAISLGDVWYSDDKAGEEELCGVIRDMVGNGVRWADIHITHNA